jgi:WD40 repeat protein
MGKGVSCCILVDASKVWAGTTNNTILVFDTATRGIASSIIIPSNISLEKKTITKMVPSGDKIWAILSNIVVQLSLDGEALNFIELKPEVFIYDVLAVKQQLWICGDDKTISVWNQEAKKGQEPVKVLQQQAFCLLNTGDEIWSGGWDRKISVWTDYVRLFLPLFFASLT